MAERSPQGGGTAREPTSKGSTSTPTRFAGFRAATRDAEGLALWVTVAGAVAGVLMIVSEFLTVAFVQLSSVQSGSCASQVVDADRCELTGFERHGGALILIGILALLMAWGAGIGRSRPAGLALVIAGVVVLGLALFSDLPSTNDTGAIGFNFESAEGKAGAGFFAEVLAGILAVAAGLARALREPG